LLAGAEVAIETVSLSKTYGKSSRPAVESISLSIPRATIFTLLGKNGAGKTTFLRMAATQLKPTSGSIRVLGYDAINQTREVRERIAAVPQEMRTYEFMTPYDHVMLSLTSRGWAFAEARVQARKTLSSLGLLPYEKVHSDELSGGLRQRTLVAMALATDAELIFLDEPTIGLDPIARRAVWKLIVDLKHQGKTILLTTHYLDEAEAISDKIAIVSRGRILKVGTVLELKASLRETVRVDIAAGFYEDELRSFGKVIRVGENYRVLTDEQRASRLVALAIERKARTNVSPVSLDDVFIDLVGEGENEDDEEKDEDR
jgi:ABC-2 type transport system ATP-binding protein